MSLFSVGIVAAATGCLMKAMLHAQAVPVLAPSPTSPVVGPVVAAPAVEDADDESIDPVADQAGPAAVVLDMSAIPTAGLELADIEVSLDGESLGHAPVEPEPDTGAFWNGRVTPGPHTLLEILVFRPRHPDPNRVLESQMVRIERRQRIHVERDRALALTFSGRRTPKSGPDVIEPFATP